MSRQSITIEGGITLTRAQIEDAHRRINEPEVFVPGELVGCYVSTKRFRILNKRYSLQVVEGMFKFQESVFLLDESDYTLAWDRTGKNLRRIP